jgi:hypothetical protein
MVFLLVWVKIATQGVSLCYFHAYMYYNPNLFISISLLHLIIPLPMVAPASLRLLYSFLYSEHIKHIQVFGFLSSLIPPV